MRIANDLEVSNRRLQAAVIVCVGGVDAGGDAGLAQGAATQRTGVSHPDSAPITVDADDTTVAAPTSAPAKPSAAVPATDRGDEFAGRLCMGRMFPTARRERRSRRASSASAFDPDANIVTAATAGQDRAAAAASGRAAKR